MSAVKALVIDAMRNRVSARDRPFRLEVLNAEPANVDEFAVGDDSIHDAGYVRVERVVGEDLVDLRERRGVGCLRAGTVHLQCGA